MFDRKAGLPACLVMLVTAGALAAPVPGHDLVVGRDAPGSREVEPGVAVAPNDPRHVVVVAQTGARQQSSTVVAWVSTDGGQRWSDGIPLPGASLASQTDPSVTYCPDGAVYAAYMDAGSGTIAFRVVRSLDGGMSWELRSTALFDATGLDVPLLVCDDSGSPIAGRLYLRYGSVGHIYVIHSDDGGASWSASTQVDTNPGAFSNFPGQMVIGPDGEVWIGWVDNLLSLIRVNVSRNGGLHFGAPETVGSVGIIGGLPETDYRRTSKPTLAIDRSNGPDRGTLYCAYASRTADPSDVQFSRRPAAIATWTPPIRLNDDPPGNGRRHDFPRAFVDETGVLRVVWLDHRNDPGDGSTEVYLTSSRDGGVTFDPSLPVDTAPFVEPTGDGAFLGDHIGLVAHANLIFPFWTDRRRDDGDIVTTAVRDFPFTEVEGVTVTHSPDTVVSWTSQDPTYGTDVVYDVLSGRLDELRADRGFDRATCAADDWPDTPWIDPRPDPPPGSGTYYLVRSQRGAERSTYGAVSGAPDPRVALDLVAPCL